MFGAFIRPLPLLSFAVTVFLSRWLNELVEEAGRDLLKKYREKRKDSG